MNFTFDISTHLPFNIDSYWSISEKYIVRRINKNQLKVREIFAQSKLNQNKTLKLKKTKVMNFKVLKSLFRTNIKMKKIEIILIFRDI